MNKISTMGRRHAEVLQEPIEKLGSEIKKQKLSKRDGIDNKTEKKANRSRNSDAVEKKKSMFKPSFHDKETIGSKFNTQKDTPKKPNWIKVKEKKKELKVERKKKKSLFEVGVKSKQMWEQLRKKDCSKVQKNDMCRELHELLKGNYKKAVHCHDLGRVAQWQLKLGSPEIRQEIALELKDSFVEMFQSKYGVFCIKQLLKRGSREAKDLIIKACMGNVVKLMSHRTASPVISNLYSSHSNSLQKCHLRQEFYGEIYRVMKNDDVKELKQALEYSNEMRDSMLSSTKANLLKVINKDLVDSQLVNAVLAECIPLCNESDRSELISAVVDFLPQMLKTKEGARVGMCCVWHGTQKDRKSIIKSLKSSVNEIAVCEHGHFVLLSIFDSVDDTVLVKKALLPDITNNVLDLSKDKFGRKVVLYLVAPRKPLYFHPSVVEILKQGDGNAHSKKSLEARWQELLSAVSEPFLESVTNNLPAWLDDSSIGMVALAILNAGKGPSLKTAYEALANHICSNETEESESNSSLVENAGYHIILKKLISFDKNKDAENEVLFSEVLVDSLTKEIVLHLVKTNRGCFLLVAMLGTQIESCVNKLREKLKGGVYLTLKKQTSKGSEILIEKMKHLTE